MMPVVDTSIILEALGTEWRIATDRLNSSLQKQVTTIISDFENRFSRFKNDSELSRLNYQKTLQDPSDELVAMLRYAIKMHHDSQGIFNISVASELEKNGYGISHRDSRLSVNLSDDVVVGDSLITISDLTLLDFGGFGKGWLIDKVGSFLRSEGVEDYIINGGGDILVGKRAEQIYIEHPLQHSKHTGSVVLCNEALASSSRLKRVWMAPNGKMVDHIIDPFSSDKNNTNIASTHVRAGSALVADTFSTIFLLATQDQRNYFVNQFGIDNMQVHNDMSYVQTVGFRFLPNVT